LIDVNKYFIILELKYFIIFLLALFGTALMPLTLNIYCF